MKKIATFLIVIQFSAWGPERAYSAEYSQDNYLSARGILYFLILGNLMNTVLSDNCSDAGPFSDAQTEAFVWFQIGTGIFATVLIANNFFAAWLFYRKMEKNLANEIQERINDHKEENKFLVQINKDLGEVLKLMRAEMAIGDNL